MPEPQITLTDVCSGMPLPLYLKNIKEVQPRYAQRVVDGRPHEVASGSIVYSGPGNYRDEVKESPEVVAELVENAGGTITLF
jgi:hypothetical protein